MESLILGGSSSGGVSLPANTGHHLGDDAEIQNDGTSQEGVFTNVGHAECERYC